MAGLAESNRQPDEVTRVASFLETRIISGPNSNLVHVYGHCMYDKARCSQLQKRQLTHAEIVAMQVDMMSQGDSIYDFVDRRDHAVWKSNLTQAARAVNLAHVRRRYDTTDRHHTTTTVADSLDRAFYCRMYRARNCRRLPPACTEHKVFFSNFARSFHVTQMSRHV